MIEQLPALIINVPLLIAFGVAIAGWLAPRLCAPLSLVTLAFMTLCGLGLLWQVTHVGPLDYYMGGWRPPWGIAYRVDPLNGLVLTVIAAVALINLIANIGTVQQSFPDKIGPFYTLYLLFVTGLSGIVITGDAFNLYVLLEISSLTGYALIGLGQERSPLSALNYLFLGTIGASFYLLGVGYLYISTGSLNMEELAVMLPPLYSSRVVLFAFILCLVGLFVKMALFPLHVWLPNAYSHASSPAAGLIAPLTTKVMIYVMIRIILYVFTPAYSFTYLNIAPALVWLAVIAIVMGSILALAQVRLKKLLCYVIIAEVGYMVGGFWLGNATAMTGAILHIVNDAAMTLCVFLAAGGLLTRLPDDRLESLQGLFKRMPVSMAALITAGLAIIGVPPFCGFFSKWYLISGALEVGHYGFVVALIFSSLVNVVLFFRIIEIAYYEPLEAGAHHAHHPPEPIAEAPVSMLVPLLATAAALILLGLYTGDIVTGIIQLALPVQII